MHDASLYRGFGEIEKKSSQEKKIFSVLLSGHLFTVSYTQAICSIFSTIYLIYTFRYKSHLSITSKVSSSMLVGFSLQTLNQTKDIVEFGLVF